MARCSVTPGCNRAARPGKKSCQHCGIALARRQLNLKMNRYRAGRCAACGKPKGRARARNWYCTPCAARAAERSRNYRLDNA